MRDQLSIALAPSDAGVRVVTAGTLDWRASPRLAAYLERVAATFEAPIELDLRAVTEIDPQGVALLVGLRRRFRRRLRIVPSHAVARTVHFVARGERNRRGDDSAARRGRA